MIDKRTGKEYEGPVLEDGPNCVCATCVAAHCNDMVKAGILIDVGNGYLKLAPEYRGRKDGP
jgi:hypothetical protein